FDRIPAIEQDTFVAINVGNMRFATRRRGKSGIVSEHSGRGIKLADIDDRRSDRAGLDGHFDGCIADAKGAGRGAHGGCLLLRFVAPSLAARVRWALAPASGPEGP